MGCAIVGSKGNDVTGEDDVYSGVKFAICRGVVDERTEPQGLSINGDGRDGLGSDDAQGLVEVGYAISGREERG